MDKDARHLILWRHAQAVDPTEDMDDLKRPLTAHGERQAHEMAAWLKRHLPEHTQILVSPALRTRQTAMHLARHDDYKLVRELAPGASVQDVLHACRWPRHPHPVLVVGHQPTLGQVAQELLGMQMPCAIKKGAVWWLQQRTRHDETQIILRAVQNPALL